MPGFDLAKAAFKEYEKAKEYALCLILPGNIINRLHVCVIRIFWNRYGSERNICIVGRLAVSFL